jgi:5-methylcytosine-specific restriction enzyme subunit McrC
MKPRLTKPTIVNLTEWQRVFCADLVLSDADRQLAETLGNGEDGRIEIDELRTGIRITASSWVGVVRFENFEIRIAPKLTGGNLGLIEMLEFISGIDALRRYKNIRHLNALQDSDSLLDLIALLFAEACKIVIRAGLLADYVEREDEIPYVRGRFLGERQMFKRFGQIDRVICRFDELEQDILENQLILAALQICGKRVAHELVKP